MKINEVKEVLREKLPLKERTLAKLESFERGRTEMRE
jgi:hypothetical protein